MLLPGKLCVGILEEDNPLRSYFRFKPLLIDEGGRYTPCTDAVETYPQEGGIRIVPDKNESYHFKARMREIGLFCVVDLREHPGESDKIRPNKNFRPDGDEVNASIIYSDVVRAPAEDMIFEIISAEAAVKLSAAPRTPVVLVRGAEGVNPRRYAWQPASEAEGAPVLAATEQVCDLEAVQVFDLPGFKGETISFAIRPAGALSRVSDMPERPARAEAPEGVQVVRPAAEPPRRKPEPAPQPKEVPEEAGGEKPWIHHDESILPPPVNPRLSRAEQIMAAQAGLNPRRGRSLQELIDEKWQRSRLNQLGQPVQPIATGAPVASPVEVAVSAVREAWQQPGLRGALMEALGEIGDLTTSIEAHREAARQSAVAAELVSMEAQKLSLKGEIEHLKAGAADIRQKLKQEIRREDADALAETRLAIETAQTEKARCERQAEDARAAAQDARALVDQLTGDQLEQKIRDVALTRRVLERLELLKGEGGAAGGGAPETIDAEALIERVVARFAAEGWALTRLEAANLCVGLALSPALLITGAPGSGKTTAARLLAEALGLEATRVEPGMKAPWKDERLAALKGAGDRPALILFDDANLAPAADPFRGLLGGMRPEWRAVAALQDAHSGHPVSAAAWDKGFALRLTPPAKLPWRPADRTPAPRRAPVSIEAVRKSLPQAEIPASAVEKLDAMRQVLGDAHAVVSRRALDDAWRYTAAMLALMGGEADANAILDLAVAQRLLPGLLASAPVEAVLKLRPFISGMPACAALLAQPLPLML